jgi:hypothetical protein
MAHSLLQTLQVIVRKIYVGCHAVVIVFYLLPILAQIHQQEILQVEDQAQVPQDQALEMLLHQEVLQHRAQDQMQGLLHQAVMALIQEALAGHHLQVPHQMCQVKVPAQALHLVVQVQILVKD